MRRSSFWVILLSLLIVNGVIFAWFGMRTGDAHPEPLTTGERIPPISGAAIPSGEQVVLPSGRWSLVLYLSEASPANQRRLVGAQSLLDRFGTDRLEVAAVVPEPFPDVTELRATEEVHFPVLHDGNGTLLRRLRLAHPTDTLFLFDERRRLRFQSIYGSYGVTEMRYLAEKHLEGRIAYPEEATGIRIAVGDALPMLGLRDFSTGEIVERFRSARGSILVFFTSECSTCSLGPSMATFRAFESRFVQDGRRVVSVFSSLFSPIEVAGHAAKLGIQAPLLTTDEEPLRFVGPGGGSGGLDSDLMVVELDEHGIVRSIRPLTDATKELEL